MSPTRVVMVDRFGGPEVLRPALSPAPAVGPGEVVVEVAAVDVLFVDTLIRSGRASAFFALRPPYVPGNGFAGTVVEAGPGEGRSWLGRRVVAHTGGPGGSGGYAERAVLPSHQVVAVPDGVDLLEAAALLHDGVTALSLMTASGIRSGEVVLVLGAAGGMGVLLLQLARQAGAQVIGAAKGPRKVALVAAFEAVASVDYGEAGWVARVLDATAGAGVDVVLDGVGGDLGQDALDLLKVGGRFSAHGAASGAFAPVSEEQVAAHGGRLLGLGDLQVDDVRRSELIERTLADAAGGHLRPHIGQTFPLEDAAGAHRAIEGRRALSKTLLIP